MPPSQVMLFKMFMSTDLAPSLPQLRHRETALYTTAEAKKQPRPQDTQVERP
jgi:hypothetical protein